jgi:hypothetical protein
MSIRHAHWDVIAGAHKGSTPVLSSEEARVLLTGMDISRVVVCGTAPFSA